MEYAAASVGVAYILKRKNITIFHHECAKISYSYCCYLLDQTKDTRLRWTRVFPSFSLDYISTFLFQQLC